MSQTRACWYKPRVKGVHTYWKTGLFHQWGMEMAPEHGRTNFSIGIVEDCETHRINTPKPECVSFGAEEPTT